MSLPDIQFPAIGFMRPDKYFDQGSLQGFIDEEKMKVCGEPAAEHDAARGMEIVDSAGRSWVVVEARYTERPRNFWQRMFDPREFDLDMTLEPRPDVSFEAVRERVCALIAVDDPLNWVDDESLSGEAEEPVDEQAQVNAVIAKVRRTRKVADILKMFDLVDPIY